MSNRACTSHEQHSIDTPKARQSICPLSFRIRAKTDTVTPARERPRSTAEQGFRFRIWTPFSHLVLRKPAGAETPKPESRMGFWTLAQQIFFCLAVAILHVSGLTLFFVYQGAMELRQERHRVRMMQRSFVRIL